MTTHAEQEAGGGEAAEKGERLLLASASPRRLQLLGLLGVRFTVVVSRFDENTLAHLTDPEKYVYQAALSKAEEVARRREGVILGADTDVIDPDGRILGKPENGEAARQMLLRLSGKTHDVFGGVAVLRSNGQGDISHREVRVVRTRVTFAALSDAAIDAYVATGEPLDKAGAYGIQGGALAFVSHISGDLSNVIGLPLTETAEMLCSAGVKLWNAPSPTEAIKAAAQTTQTG